MKPNQERALKKLNAAFLSCKRAGLIFVAIDNCIAAVSVSDELEETMRSSSDCEHIRRMAAQGEDVVFVSTYGAFRDSGGA